MIGRCGSAEDKLEHQEEKNEEVECYIVLLHELWVQVISSLVPPFAVVFTVNSPALELERKCVGARMRLCSLHVLTWGEEVAG